MTLPPDAAAALARFADCTSWEARARLLMQEGERLAPLAPEQQIEANRVQGCESQVWLVGEQNETRWYFRAATDARLLRGLLALLLARVNGLDGASLQALDLGPWFSELGLQRQLTPSRTNGLSAVLKQMKATAQP